MNQALASLNNDVPHKHMSGLTEPENRLNLEKHFPPTYEIGGWSAWSDRGKLRALRKVAMHYGRDPRLRERAVDILRNAGAESRDYPAQARALLQYVQQHVYYVNETGEQVQSPFYTMRKGFGDCDDMAVLIAAFAESIALPWRFCLAGTGLGGKPVMYHEGGWMPWFVQFSHIYLQIGWPPFKPTTWMSVEPTVPGAPLGYDVVRDGVPTTTMPELAPQAALSGWIVGRTGYQGWGNTYQGWGNTPDAQQVAAANAAAEAATQAQVAARRAEELAVAAGAAVSPRTFWARIDWHDVEASLLHGLLVSVTIAVISPLVIRTLGLRRAKK